MAGESTSTATSTAASSGDDAQVLPTPKGPSAAQMACASHILATEDSNGSNWILGKWGRQD